MKTVKNHSIVTTNKLEEVEVRDSIGDNVTSKIMIL